MRKGERISGLTERQGALPVVGSKFEFQDYGKSKLRMSELLPHLGEVADDLLLIRSLQTDHVLHEAAMTILFTGTPLLGRPSWGAWTSYALIASHVVVSGGVEIGEQCFIGVNATLRDHIRIGARCVVGAGALLLEDAEPEGVYVGAATERSRVPSSRLRKI